LTDRDRSIKFEDDRYTRVGTKKAVSLRPYRARLREDKTVNPRDLRLEQVSYFVNRVRRIKERWQKVTLREKDLLEYLS
jgi:hypothetical protein